MKIAFDIGTISARDVHDHVDTAVLDENEASFILKALRAVRAVENEPHNLRAIDKLADALGQAVA